MSYGSEKAKSAAQWRLESVLGSIDRICLAWPDAIKGAAAVGYPATSGGSNSGSGISDRTGSTAAHLADKSDVAMAWLTKARRVLVILLRASDASGSDWRSTSRWNGEFSPPVLRSTFAAAAQDLSDFSPKGVHKLFNTIVSLGNEAANNWPPTPQKGQTIDGVKVLERTRTGEECTLCGKYVAGDAVDPIRRLDGKPYHASTCYYQAWRKRNKGKPVQQPA